MLPAVTPRVNVISGNNKDTTLILPLGGGSSE